MFGILDPTISTARETIPYVPRPRELRGLRVGLVENTRKNSEAVLRALVGGLASAHGVVLGTVVHKQQRAPLSDAELAELKGRADFVIAGVGD